MRKQNARASRPSAASYHTSKQSNSALFHASPTIILRLRTGLTNSHVCHRNRDSHMALPTLVLVTPMKSSRPKCCVATRKVNSIEIPLFTDLAKELSCQTWEYTCIGLCPINPRVEVVIANGAGRRSDPVIRSEKPTRAA